VLATGYLGQVHFSALTVSVKLRTELADQGGARGVPRSRRLPDTTSGALQTTRHRNGL